MATIINTVAAKNILFMGHKIYGYVIRYHIGSLMAGAVHKFDEKFDTIQLIQYRVWDLNKSMIPCSPMENIKYKESNTAKKREKKIYKILQVDV